MLVVATVRACCCDRSCLLLRPFVLVVATVRACCYHHEHLWGIPLLVIFRPFGGPKRGVWGVKSGTFWSVWGGSRPKIRHGGSKMAQNGPFYPGHMDYFGFYPPSGPQIVHMSRVNDPPCQKGSFCLHLLFPPAVLAVTTSRACCYHQPCLLLRPFVLVVATVNTFGRGGSKGGVEGGRGGPNPQKPGPRGLKPQKTRKNTKNDVFWHFLTFFGPETPLRGVGPGPGEIPKRYGRRTTKAPFFGVFSAGPPLRGVGPPLPLILGPLPLPKIPIFDVFWSFLTFFGPFLTFFGPFLTFLGHF